MGTIQREYYRDWVNILYSGGDDVFAVGRWDLLLEFAEDIRKQFRKFVCHRVEVSLSAGLSIIGPKFPITKAAELAGEAEDEAKKYNTIDDAQREVLVKNAICFLGETVSWNTEFQTVKELKDQLVHFVSSGGLSAGFLQKLMQFQAIKKLNETDQELEDNNKTIDLSYQWKAAYTIGRYQERYKRARNQEKSKAVKGFLETQKRKLLFASSRNGYDNRYFDLAALAARWAELQLRRDKPNTIDYEQ